MIFMRFLLGMIFVAVTAKSALPVGVPLGFRTQINGLNSLNVPYTGALVIRVTNGGTLSGEYQSDSVRPDPLYGRLTPVTGTISGTHVILQIGIGTNAFSINGTASDHAITGSAMRGGTVWTFKAVRVHLKNPPAKT